MRPDDHHVEPLFGGLGHRHEPGDGNREAGSGGGGRSDPSIKWKLLAVVSALAALAWLISNQAF